jgi:hypothetical protein
MGKLRPLVPLWVSKTKASALLSRQQQMVLGQNFSAEHIFRTVNVREPISVFNEFMFNREPNEKLPSMMEMLTANDKSSASALKSWEIYIMMGETTYPHNLQGITYLH